MGKLSEQEDSWQAEATVKATIASARSIVENQTRLANTPTGKLSDQQWGWIITAAIFCWIRTRYQQALAEGLDREKHIVQMNPSPRDAAIVQSILPTLAEQCTIDWGKPLASWSRDEMTGFVGLALELIDEAQAVLDRAPDIVLQKPAEFDDEIPF